MTTEMEWGRYLRRSAEWGRKHRRRTGRGLKPSSTKNKKSIDKTSIWAYNKGIKDKENNKSKGKGEKRKWWKRKPQERLTN